MTCQKPKFVMISFDVIPWELDSITLVFNEHFIFYSVLPFNLGQWNETIINSTNNEFLHNYTCLSWLLILISEIFKTNECVKLEQRKYKAIRCILLYRFWYRCSFFFLIEKKLFFLFDLNNGETGEEFLEKSY